MGLKSGTPCGVEVVLYLRMFYIMSYGHQCQHSSECLVFTQPVC